MKKIFSIVISIVLLLGAVSCTELLAPELREVKQEIPEGATLTMGFRVPTEVATKASRMASDPDIESIHVLIFDEEGTLLQVREATLSTTRIVSNYDPDDPDQSTMVSSWSIDYVMMSAEKRILHFVANLPDNQVPQSGSETSIFQSLAVTAPQAAYWQRVTLDNILPYQYPGEGVYSYVDDDGIVQRNKSVPYTLIEGSDSYKDALGYTVNKLDYIDHQGNKVVNGTGYYYVPDVGTPLDKMIPLVRNFARIQFTNNWSAFTLKKIALVNTPKSGLVAPFESSGFVEAYTDLVNQPTGTRPTIESLKNDNGFKYKPLLPSDGINTDLPEIIDVDGTTATLFMYERGIPATEKATCVLIGGNFDGGADVTTWYKIEITQEDGSYFPFYRDFTYIINLSKIDPSATKHTSAADALAALPVGDISNSPETATLTKISDGNGLILCVSYIDFPDLTGGRKVPLMYTFFRESGSTKTYYCEGDNDKVTFSREPKPGSNLGWATTETVDKKGAITDEQNSEYLSKVPDSEYQWYLAEVTLNARGDTPLQSNIHVEGKVNTKKLSRDVTYTVMGQQELELKTTGLSSDAQSTNQAPITTVLSIKLPNTFGPSVFPLTLKIEAEDNNLMPTGNLSVESGKSTFDPSKSTFYFLKTISYSEYLLSAKSAENPYVFDCEFKTTEATGKTPVTRIRVTEKIPENQDRISWLKDGDYATVDLKVGSTSTNN